MAPGWQGAPDGQQAKKIASRGPYASILPVYQQRDWGPGMVKCVGPTRCLMRPCTFLVPAHPGSPGQRAIKRVCVCVCVCVCYYTPERCLQLMIFSCRDGTGVRSLSVQARAGLQLVEPRHHHRRRLRQQRTLQLHCTPAVARSTQNLAQPHHTPARKTVC